MNRPWGVLQFVETEHFANRIEEEYIFVIETDHMMMRPFENIATPDKPVGCARAGQMAHTRTASALPLSLTRCVIASDVAGLDFITCSVWIRSCAPSSRSSSSRALRPQPSTPSARAHYYPQAVVEARRQAVVGHVAAYAARSRCTGHLRLGLGDVGLQLSGAQHGHPAHCVEGHPGRAAGRGHR